MTRKKNDDLDADRELPTDKQFANAVASARALRLVVSWFNHGINGTEHLREKCAHCGSAELLILHELGALITSPELYTYPDTLYEDLSFDLCSSCTQIELDK